MLHAQSNPYSTAKTLEPLLTRSDLARCNSNVEQVSICETRQTPTLAPAAYQLVLPGAQAFVAACHQRLADKSIPLLKTTWRGTWGPSLPRPYPFSALLNTLTSAIGHIIAAVPLRVQCHHQGIDHPLQSCLLMRQ